MLVFQRVVLIVGFRSVGLQYVVVVRVIGDVGDDSHQLTSRVRHALDSRLDFLIAVDVFGRCARDERIGEYIRIIGVGVGVCIVERVVEPFRSEGVAELRRHKAVLERHTPTCSPPESVAYHSVGDGYVQHYTQRACTVVFLVSDRPIISCLLSGGRCYVYGCEFTEGYGRLPSVSPHILNLYGELEEVFSFFKPTEADGTFFLRHLRREVHGYYAL